MKYKICPSCKYMNAESANFCNHCGSSLADAEIVYMDDKLNAQAEAKPVAPESESAQAVAPENESAQSGEKPVAPENESAQAEEKPVAPENESAQPEEKPDAPESESVKPEEKPGAPESESVKPEEKPGAPENENAQAEEKPGAPENENAQAEEKPDAPESESAQVEEKPGAPENEGAHPKKKLLLKKPAKLKKPGKTEHAEEDAGKAPLKLKFKKPGNKKAKKILGIAAAVFVLLIVIAAITPQPRLKRISAEYQGDAEEGTVLDENNDDIIVIAYYDNNTSKEVSGWTIENPEELKADTVSSVTVDYKDVSCKLKVECSTSEAVSLTLEYSGDTSEGTVINKDTKGLKAYEILKNGGRKDVAAKDLKIDKEETLQKDGTVTINAEYDGLTASLDIACSDKTATGIEASYSGSTEEGTTIDSGNADMTVTARYQDDSTETVKDWTVTAPVTLEADKTSTVEIHYGDLTTTVDIQCSTQSEEGYKASCGTVAYDDLLRNPDNYKYQSFKFTGKVVQVIQGDSISAMRVNVTDKGYGYYDDTIYVYYTADQGSFIEDDMVDIYGSAFGNYTYTAVLGNAVTVPLIYASYVDLR